MKDTKGCKHICLFGGPGSGKSTAAAALFAKMKMKGYIVELVTEYAKDLVYSKDFMTLSDQIMIFAKQHHNWFKLNDQVEWTVSDAPFLLSSVYVQEKNHLDKESFIEFIVNTYKRYDTINIFIDRDETSFQQYGSIENLDESIIKDNEILDLLERNDIPYYRVYASENVAEDIYEIVSELNNNI